MCWAVCGSSSDVGLHHEDHSHGRSNDVGLHHEDHSHGRSNDVGLHHETLLIAPWAAAAAAMLACTLGIALVAYSQSLCIQ
jgi:hypothetical protein